MQRMGQIMGESIVIPASVVSGHDGNDTVVHDMITQNSYRLNDLGTRVWELIDDGKTLDAIVDVIASEYALPDGSTPSQIRDDVVALLLELAHHGLLDLTH